MLNEYSHQIIEAIIDEFDLYENDPIVIEVTNLLVEAEATAFDEGLLEGEE